MNNWMSHGNTEMTKANSLVLAMIVTQSKWKAILREKN